MKFVYIALIPILSILVVIYTILQLSYRPSVIDKKMTVLTDDLVKNSPVLNVRELASYKDTLQHPVPADVWGNNLFDPGRGGGATSVSSSGELKNIELVGVFDKGNIKGAVILIKTSGTSVSGGYGGGYGGYGQQGYYPSPGDQKKQQIPIKQKAVFKVGDRLPNGLILESVGPDFVVLRGGAESVKLKMTFSDDNSAKRTAEAMRTATKPQITIISGDKVAPGSPGGQPGGAGSPTIITPGGSSSTQQSGGIFQGYGR